MKSMLFFQSGVLGLFFIAACCKTSVETGLTSEERKAVEDTIRSFGLVFEKAINEVDLQASIDLFSDDPDFTFVEDGYIKPEKSKLYALFKPVYDNVSDFNMKFENIRIVALDKNSGVFTGEAYWSGTTLKGNVIKGHVASTYVFVKRNNKWQMIQGHASHAPN